MKITESRLRSIIQSVILENQSNNISPANEESKQLSDEQVELKKNKLKILLKDEFNVLSSGLEKNKSDSSEFEAKNIVKCVGVVSEEEFYAEPTVHEDCYLVLGFSEEEFEDKSAGGPYGRSSVAKNDSVVMIDVMYLSDENGDIFSFILDEEDLSGEIVN